MPSTQRIMKTWILGLLALVSASTWATSSPASSGGSSAVWGYHPPAEPADFCSLDSPYEEMPFTAPADPSVCPPPPESCTGAACSASEACMGPRARYESQIVCAGIAGCCLAGSVAPDGVVNVLPYLGRTVSADPAVDGTHVDDSPGIAHAIKCAMLQPTTRHTVAFPAGRYVLRSPLRPEHNDLTLEGPELSPDAAPGDPGTATLVALPCNPEQLPGAIQVNKVALNSSGKWVSENVSEVWIRNFQIELTEGPRETANSGIRMNNCSSCVVENIIMRYAPNPPQPPKCKPSNLDGITFSLGSGGVIRNVIVDGVPKGGIYLSSVTNYHATPPILVENCEVKNINGPVGAGGIKIITANVTVRNCEVHHNWVSSGAPSGGYGLWLAAQIPGVENPSPYPSNVVVQDSYFHHNSNSGVTMASPVENYRAENITLDRVKFAYNGGYGVHIQAGTGVQLLDVWSWGNGSYGMYLTSKSGLAASALRVGTVYMENPIVFDNGLTASQNLPGILLQASNITIDGGDFARCEVPPEEEEEELRGKQTGSIQQKCWQSGPTGGQVLFHPTNNVISGVDTHGTNALPEVLACNL
ncbi:hypothetical protein BE11_16570 [Sorangium cellulosum]|nr:hypothetical protein BE11_16570 [Sorangium cellulosum]